MNKNRLNFIIDVFLFLIMMAMGGIGFLLEYILIPGQESWEKYGKKVDLFYLGLDRHEWADIHLILAFIFLALLILHIIFHWKPIKKLYSCTIKNGSLRNILTILFLIISLIFLFFFLFVNPKIVEFEGRGNRHYSTTFNQKNKNLRDLNLKIDKPQEQEKESIDETSTKSTTKVRRYQNQDKSSTSGEKNYLRKNNIQRSNLQHQHKEEHQLNIRGYMTLREVSVEYNIPISYLKEKLNLPDYISEYEQLGRLRRAYGGFRMSDIEEIILNYKKNRRD